VLLLLLHSYAIYSSGAVEDKTACLLHRCAALLLLLLLRLLLPLLLIALQQLLTR
jgi:hypothetical protein